MRSDIIWVPELASQGALLNLTHQGWFQPIKKDALPGPLSTNFYKGGYYGMPDDTNTQVLFWNKADFAAAGLSGPPTTLAQLFADVPKLTNKGKGQFGLGVDGTDIWNISPYVWSSGGSFTNSGATTTSGFMNGNATESTLGQLVSLYKAGDVGTDFLGGSGAISGETGLPEGPVRHVHRRPVGRAHLPAGQVLELRPVALPQGLRRFGFGRRRRGPRHGQRRPAPGRRREAGPVPHRPVRSAADGQPGRPGHLQVRFSP